MFAAPALSFQMTVRIDVHVKTKPMKHPVWFAAVCSLAVIVGCATNPTPTAQTRTITQQTVVDAACGQCLLDLKSEKRGCDLAVRFDGQSFFVDGFTMKQLGDAHAEDGMCNTIRRAKVTGRVANGRFAAVTFEILPVEK